MTNPNQKKQSDFNLKLYLQSKDYEQKRSALSAYINKYKVEIDRSCFKKTPEEKMALKAAKKLHLKTYGKIKPQKLN